MTTIAPAPCAGVTQSEPFVATVRPYGQVQLAGELDIGSLAAFRAALNQALLDCAEVVHIDASRLEFIDSSAVSELLRYQLGAAVQRRQIRFEQVSPPVALVFDLLDLRHILMAGEGSGGLERADGASGALEER